jgi:hypothetical protein
VVVKRSGQGARLAANVVFPDGRFTGVVEWRASGQQRVLDSLLSDYLDHYLFTCLDLLSGKSSYFSRKCKFQ